MKSYNLRFYIKFFGIIYFMAKQKKFLKLNVYNNARQNIL